MSSLRFVSVDEWVALVQAAPGSRRTQQTRPAGPVEASVSAGIDAGEQALVAGGHGCELARDGRGFGLQPG